MLIVEGPDGAGKTTLIELLKTELEIPVAPRVVAQDTTALVDMKRWVEDNLAEGEVPVLFDRHRLISETIYGPIKRKHAQAGFLEFDWLSRQMDDLYNGVGPMIIYCLPPFETVKANIENDPDNTAVAHEIEQIYSAYVARASVDAVHANSRVWDYTNPAHRSSADRPYFLPTLRRYIRQIKERNNEA